MRYRCILLSVLSFIALGCVSAAAQQTTGASRSPNATTTIDGLYLPPPPQKFLGKIELNAAQSEPAWPARVVPPKGAPNILLIMTDDVGFGAPSTFGGVVPTPAPRPSVDQYTCKQIMRESGKSRKVSIAFIHDYLLGKSGATKFNIDDLLKQTYAFVDRCLDNPKEKAIEAMMKVKR